MNQEEFVVLLHHGEGNKEKTVDYPLIANGPHQAATRFLERHFPDQTLIAVRQEQPYTDNDGRLFSVWSASNTASGQRIWIKRQIGGFEAPALTLNMLKGIQ